MVTRQTKDETAERAEIAEHEPLRASDLKSPAILEYEILCGLGVLCGFFF